MEQLQNHDLDKNPIIDNPSSVDTSRPFRSVKEAMVIFGGQSSIIHTYSPKPFSLHKKEAPVFSPSPTLETEPSWKNSLSSTSPENSSCSHDVTLVDMVKKLEAELDETKAELKILKRKGSETEVALASLHAELHRSMSKLAWAEATKASQAASRSGSKEEEVKRDLLMRRTNSGPLPSLAQVLSVGEKEKLIVGRTKEKKGMKKKKTIIPLFGDLFFSSRKKGSTNTLDNPLYASPLHWN